MISSNSKKRRTTARHVGRRRTRAPRKNLLVVLGEGIHSRVAFQIPTWCVVAGLACCLLLVVVMMVSPDIAARFAFAVIQLAGLLYRPAK